MTFPPFAWPAEPVAEGLRWSLLAVWIVANVCLGLFSLHRLRTLWWWWRLPRCRDATAPPPDRWPRVTVQLPVYNERCVVERLIDAAAALRYPAGLLEIQVLDDSNDVTTRLARAAALRHRARGVDIRVLHRGARSGFKAGALADGLAQASGEIVVVFDADFVPAPDFLERVVPQFGDPEVGMVQARWGHLNPGRSWRTAAQAALLDFHFQVEHRVRAAKGLFFNFNGTAGAWRRACIESAGGWQHDTLTEDLDLSYRAQLAGWRFRFDASVVAPAELPAAWGALRSQQRRWVKGSVQTLRKLMPALLRARLPLGVKLEAGFHLGANLAYPLALLLALLAWPVALVLGPDAGSVPVALGGWLLLGLGPLALGIACVRRPSGSAIPAAIALAAGLTVHNAGAALEGFREALGAWERTPKTGDGLPARRPSVVGARSLTAGWLELATGATLAIACVGISRAGWIGATPFLLVLMAGLGAAGWGTIVEARAGGARAGRARGG